MNRTALVSVAVVAVILLGTGAAAVRGVRAQQPKAREAQDHDHDHERPLRQEGHTDADGHHEQVEERHQDSHEGPAGHDAHAHDEEDSGVQLSPAALNKFGIKTATAGPGALATRIRLPGEIVFNADRVAHIVPRAPGVVREVAAAVGDTVQAGDVMAWLESAELGEAKVDYLAKWASLRSSDVDLTRAREVHHNTVALLEVLKSSPSLETLRETQSGPMGENRGILISAYAEFVYSKAAYQRERPLYEKKVASERDFQAAEAEFKKADALYAAARDKVEFKIRRDLLEAERNYQVREIALQGARRRLYVLGLTSEEIAELERIARRQAMRARENAICNDPHCQTCKNTSPDPEDGLLPESDIRTAEEKLAWYPLRAPFDGTVIEKHLTLGEKHGDDSRAFTVADLSTVWVDIAVYQKDLGYVSEGMTVDVSAGDGMPRVEGRISYVAPVVDKETRTALARVVLANADRKLRPGLFVNAGLSIGHQRSSIVIPKQAVQRMGEESVVFLATADGFAPKAVSLGLSDDQMVQVLSGLDTGERYVTDGAFELKAMLATRGMDAHAGHGH